MDEYLDRVKEQIAKCKESIQQTNQLIELSERWLDSLYVKSERARLALPEPESTQRVHDRPKWATRTQRRR